MIPEDPSGPAWYNEIDPNAAATLRELIKAGEICPGDVDERSIEDVSPAELVRYTQRHFFAGFGVWSAAVRRGGWLDTDALVTISCPCQPFSGAGKGEGFADKRHLWPAGYWHIALGAPVPVLGEQVASDDGLAWLDVVFADLEASDYTPGTLDLCAAGFGAPHIRQRLYWMAYPELSGASRHGEHGRRGAADAGRLWVGPGSSSGVDGMENAERLGWGARGSSLSGLEGGDALAEHGGESRGLGYAGREGLAERKLLGGVSGGTLGTFQGEKLERRGNHGGMGNAGLIRYESWSGPREALSAGREVEGQGDKRERSGRTAGDDGAPSGLVNGYRPGPANGFWQGADWLRCRPEPGYPEGRFRPVEAGTFPLAHGVASRMGLLRGFGNAIVEPVAKEFAQAAREILVEMGWQF